MATIQNAPKSLLVPIFLLLVVLTTSTSAGDCPSAAAIKPCTCESWGLSCSDKALGDTQMSKMLNLFNTKGLVMVTMNNALTKVPDEVTKFTENSIFQLSNNKIASIPVGKFKNLQAIAKIDLSENLIASIPAEAFNFPLATDIEVLLTGNPISSISPGFFKAPNAKRVLITLANTRLTRFEKDVFKPVLESFAKFAVKPSDARLQIQPIDCDTDKCHLAWLFRDNSHLLKYVIGACSNGIDVANLLKKKPNHFTNCL